MAFCLKIKFVCQRSECASTLDPQASLMPVLSIITLNHLKSGCRDVKKRGDVYTKALINKPMKGQRHQKVKLCPLTHLHFSFFTYSVFNSVCFLNSYMAVERERFTFQIAITIKNHHLRLIMNC